MPDEGRGAVLLTLGNYSDAALARHVRIRAGDKDVSSTQVSVLPGVSTVKLPLPAGLPPVRVTLDDDALLRDNEVMLVELRLAIRVRRESPGGRSRPRRQPTAIAALSSVTHSESSGQLQFVPADGIETPPLPGVWRAAFGRPPSRLVGEGTAQDFAGPFVLEKRHPLLAGVTLAGVVWAGALPLSSSAGYRSYRPTRARW